jgi:hypothetical protein
MLLNASFKVMFLIAVDNVVRMARYICHLSDWGAMATIASRAPLVGFPFANVFSISDGPQDNSTGGQHYIECVHLGFFLYEVISAS